MGKNKWNDPHARFFPDRGRRQRDRGGQHQGDPVLRRRRRERPGLLLRQPVPPDDHPDRRGHERQHGLGVAGRHQRAVRGRAEAGDTLLLRGGVARVLRAHVQRHLRAQGGLQRPNQVAGQFLRREPPFFSNR